MKNSLFIRTLMLLWLFAGVSSTAGLAQPSCSNIDPTLPLGIVPTYIQGNPPLCPGGVRIDPADEGTYPLDAFGHTVTIDKMPTPCGEVLMWTVSPGIVMDKVCVKGGNEANDYDYTLVSPPPTTDGYLHAPLNVNNNTYHDISHIDFCFHYQLTVSKTAVAEFTRTYDWTLDKECLGGPLVLSVGQVYNYPFRWTVSATYTDSDFQVTGLIAIANNTPFSATITGVSDVLSTGEVATLDLTGVTFPYELVSGATLQIPYTASLLTSTNGINTVTVNTSTPLVEGNTASAGYLFGMPTNEVDDCVEVTEDCLPPITVCYAGAPFVYNYLCNVGPYAYCGSYSYTNTATMTTNTTSTEAFAYCEVPVEVPCMGCTLTQGYWKTHSAFGPAPYDDTWALLPNGANTPFFLSGKTWYQVFWTPPAGNAYYNLAHQYMAAKLNLLNGAGSTASVNGAIMWSEMYFFSVYTPSNWPAGKRKTALGYATTLDNYNNGLIGPGHCTEGIDKLMAVDRAEVAPAASIVDLKLYPNPGSTAVNLDLSAFEAGEPMHMMVFNILGELVMQETLDGYAGDVYTLNCSDMVPGQYFVVVYHAKGTSRANLTVAR